MSSANPVPETIGLIDDERAIDSIRAAGAKVLMRDGLQRLRVADGFSHSRAMAFQLVLALIPGTIVLVAIASELRWETLSNAIIDSVQSLAPGPTADVFREAFGQGEDAGSTESGWTALSVAGPALLIAGTTAFGQVERTANRIYGVEADRQSVQKYTLRGAHDVERRHAGGPLLPRRRPRRRLDGRRLVVGNGVADRKVAGRARSGGRCDRARLQALTPAQPAADVMARLRRHRGRGRVADRHAAPDGVPRARARASATRTARSPASWACCCGPTAARSRCSTGWHARRSSKRSGPGSQRHATRRR